MRLARLCFAALMFCFMGEPVGAARAPQPRVMIVGVAHLIARRDVHNSVFKDSPLSAKRQVEISEIVTRLARFHPTKVLIEAPFGDEKYADEYRRYLAGHLSLDASEVYQYGFKLAALARDRTVYPIDTWGPPIYDDNSSSGKRINAYLKTHFNSVRDQAFDRYLMRNDEVQSHGTYLDELRFLNSDEAIVANASWYSVFDGVGRNADDAGSAYVAQWYTRNCYIFSNILDVVRPGDRVVVLIGQGHEFLLRQFVRLNPKMVDVNPLPYLK